MGTVLTELRERFSRALRTLVDDVAPLLDMIQPAQNPQFGDYQANFAMPLGKQLQEKPRDVAARLLQQVDVGDLCEPPTIAGPGFINLRLLTPWLQSQLESACTDDRLRVPETPQPQTYVVDYSSPNVAKPMHVGHIRSTVIGDALCRCLRFVGHRVISDNHLGDWGTQFGMILYGFRHFVDAQAYADAPVQELGRLYRLVRQIMDIQDSLRQLPLLEASIRTRERELQASRDQLGTLDAVRQKQARKAIAKAESDLADAQRELAERTKSVQAARADQALATMVTAHPEIEKSVLAETARLHAGDPASLSLWREFLPACRQDINAIYDRLHVAFDHELGESFYHDRLSGIIDSLTEAQLLRESEGALCVFADEFDTPMIVRKQDGAFLYSTTDLATIEYRVQTWNPDVILYVVDFRQSEHFEKLFAAARRWKYPDVALVHVKFGTVLGPDGKPYKTRSGDTVGLAGLLDEAEQRAADVVRENDDQHPEGPQLSDEQRRHIAKVVGIAALKYADLSQNRSSDYVFSYDKMLALNGNTATYMQYSYARVQSIFARGNIDVSALRAEPQIVLEHAAERALGLQLLRFGDSIDEVLRDYRPNQLTNYLFDLAKTFSTFFEQCPVLKCEQPERRSSRLLLCDLTARTLKQGLQLLGIEVVDRM